MFTIILVIIIIEKMSRAGWLDAGAWQREGASTGTMIIIIIVIIIMIIT